MAEQHNTPAHISNVHLKGYKSIRDMEVRLNPGLNIIIGKNGSGKTNFVEFLWQALMESAVKIENPYEFEIDFKTESDILQWSQVFNGHYEQFEGLINKTPKIKVGIVINNESKEDSIFEMGKHQIMNHIMRNQSLKNSKVSNSLFPIKISFSAPIGEAKISTLDEHGSINIKESSFEYKMKNSLFEFNASRISDETSLILEGNMTSEILELNKKLKLQLKKYSPIQDMKLSEGINIKIGEKNSSLVINYINIEFYVNSEWLTWQQLSDGTKRIFYIISQVNYQKGLVFLEEPENGVHPDQLYLLMDFIKEQSKEKQIILTTHSPEVLNILEKDELDRIIVTRFEEDKKTQMHHLSEKQKAKAMLYMEETSNLSDFWVHSTLEEYEAELETAE